MNAWLGVVPIASLVALCGGLAPRGGVAREVDFAREVRPILEAHCVACHGAEKDKAELRLDVRERAFAGAYAGTAPVIVPGDANASSFYQRLVTHDEDERMPQKAPRLADEQIEVLRRWIDAGAPWPDDQAGSDRKGVGHWAYRAPVRPATPAVANTAWVRNPIDAFVLARLETNGLAPAPEADRATLLRRLSLDLTGLPPTIAELDEFERDTRADAYERQVDRLLASLHYGERMARMWLDLARYADTQGYEKDARRTQWPYRDWVIDAFNRNQGFDRFTVEQLAGDLLPNATTQQRLATGFHRNTMLNEEGGTDDEEFRSAAVIDRVNTTAAVWLGSTLACAQCHDHKYDPFSQREYYSLYAVFNSTADGGKSSEPVLAALTPAEEARVRELDARATELERELNGPNAELDVAQAQWELGVSASLAASAPWSVWRPTTAYSAGRRDVRVLDDGSALVDGAAPPTEVLEALIEPGELEADVLRLEALRDPSLPSSGPGAAPNGNFVLSDLSLLVLRAGDASNPVPVRFAFAEASFEQSRATYRAAHSIDPSPETGWAVGGAPSAAPLFADFVFAERLKLNAGDRVHVLFKHVSKHAQHSLGRFRLSSRRDDEARELADGLTAMPWRLAGPFRFASRDEALASVPGPQREHLADEPWSPSYAGGVRWSESSDWVDRVAHRLRGDATAWCLERRIVSREARKIELFVGADDALRLWLNGALVAQSDDYHTLTDEPLRIEVELAAGENRVLLKTVNFDGEGGFFFDLGHSTSDRLPELVRAALAIDAGERSQAQALAVRDFFRRACSPLGGELAAELEANRAAARSLRSAAPTALVMEELATPRETRIFQRGSFLSPGDEVAPDAPAVLGRLDAAGVPPRLAFARWLVNGRNPLTARVHVNRLWELLFGRGLVATSADFGTRGDAPTHPKLLDWLAVEFVDGGWDQKALLREIVTSATYRQSSDVGAAGYEADPDNLRLARGARFRVEVEMLRDIALEAAGLLVDRIGGPSVMPPQPAGVWRSAYSSDDWSDAQGDERFRRGLYTFWKRTAPYLTFSLFEAPSRELLCTRRDRTNTPLQALALLDDPAFVEASVALARRALLEAEGDPRRITRAFRLCTARRPSSDELTALQALLDASRAAFAAEPDSARARIESAAATAPLASAGEDFDDVELAAWTSLASVILNLDETVTRQ